MPDDVYRRLEQTQALERDAQAQLTLLGRRLAAAERVAARVPGLERALRDAEERLEVSGARIGDLERRNRELDATAQHFREVNEGLMSSASWRVTRPLRAAKRRAT